MRRWSGALCSQSPVGRAPGERYDRFCDVLRVPQRLNEYAQRSCNRAAHVGELTAQDCKAARDYRSSARIRCSCARSFTLPLTGEVG
jgi:hypothetical protein